MSKLILISLVFLLSISNINWFYFLGGDINDIYFLNNYNIFTDSILWQFKNGFGSPDSGSRIQMVPIFWVINLFKSLTSPITAQNIFYFIVLSGLVYGANYFGKFFLKLKKEQIIFTLLYVSSFFVWQLLYRGLDFVNISLFIAYPILLRLILDSVKLQKINWWAFLPVAYLFSVVFTNPGYAFYSLLFIPVILFLATKLELIQLTRLSYTLLVKQFFIIIVIALPAIVSWLIYFFTNTNNYDETWQRGVLTLGSLVSQQDGSRLIFSLRGLNSDVAFQDAFLNGKPYYFLNNVSWLSNPLLIALQLVPALLIFVTPLFIKSKKLFYSAGIFLLCIVIYKSAAEPFGFFMEALVKNIPQLSVLRNPHQKAGVPIGLLFSLCAVLAIPYLSKVWQKISYISLSILIFAQIVLFFLPFTHQLNRVKPFDIPAEYYPAADYINKTDTIQKVIILPDTNRTWLDTTYNYDGYPILPKLSTKSFYNIQQVSSNKDNHVLFDITNKLMAKDTSGFELMKQYGVDTIVVDDNLDPTSRGRTPEFNFKEWKEWWLRENKFSNKQSFGKLIIYNDESVSNQLFSVTNGNILSIVKISDYEYRINLQSLENSRLTFNTSFSKYWVSSLRKIESDRLNTWEIPNKTTQEYTVTYTPGVIRDRISFYLVVFIAIAICFVIYYDRKIKTIAK
jgi:hypothetical protein